MTRKERAIVTTWTAVLISALAVLIASVGVGVVVVKVRHNTECNNAWIKQYNAAVNARTPFADKQNAALISAFGLLSLPPGSTPPKPQLADLYEKGAAFTSSAKAYEKAKTAHPYPTSACPIKDK